TEEDKNEVVLEETEEDKDEVVIEETEEDKDEVVLEETEEDKNEVVLEETEEDKDQQDQDRDVAADTESTFEEVFAKLTENETSLKEEAKNFKGEKLLKLKKLKEKASAHNEKVDSAIVQAKEARENFSDSLSEEEEQKLEGIEESFASLKLDIVELKAQKKKLAQAKEEEKEQYVSSLVKENKGLETTVCKQSNQIADLEKEMKALQQASTGYMPLMDTMNQLMMMNMMMANQQNQISYQNNPVDMMSSMMAPMMMMQSMQMGMNIASMNDLYHRTTAPMAPMAPQYNYNVGGDFYGRDYSVMGEPQQPSHTPPQAYTSGPGQPFGYDFSARNPNFGDIEPVTKRQDSQSLNSQSQRAPSQTEESSEPEQALAADEEMVD
ncbi:MAG: hypothetical protein WEB87_02305, partial [Bacteriovoracaceae bacterium]